MVQMMAMTLAGQMTCILGLKNYVLTLISLTTLLQGPHTKLKTQLQFWDNIPKVL